MDGRKDDSDKLRFDLLPNGAVKDVIRVLMHGAAKYGDDNWRKVADGNRRYYSAAMRHLTAWWDSEAIDAESGMSHLAHAACCVLFLIERERSYTSGATPDAAVAVEDTTPTVGAIDVAATDAISVIRGSLAAIDIPTIVDKSGLPRRTVEGQVARAVDDGKIVRIARGLYAAA